MSEFDKSGRNALLLAKTFLVIGCTSFGGHMALIAMIRERLVVKKKLIDENCITEAIALGSLLPGPLAVNVVAYISYRTSGLLAAVFSVVAVLFPSFLLVLALSMIFFKYHSVFEFRYFLMGVMPVVVGLIFSMAFSLAKKNITSKSQWGIALASIGVFFVAPSYITIIAVVLLSGLVGAFFFRGFEVRDAKLNSPAWGYAAVLVFFLSAYWLFRAILGPTDINVKLFTEFAKSSLTLFGGGYVMIPVLQTLLVEQLHWINEREFLVGISLGQITPGPILISAVFFGYKLNGMLGAIVASIGMFMPPALLMIACSKFYAKVSANLYIASALQGVKPAIVGLIVYSGLQIVRLDTLFSNMYYLILFAIMAFILIERFKLNSATAVLVGGIAGGIYSYIHYIS